MKKVLLPIVLFVMFFHTAFSQEKGINSWTVNFGVDARVYAMVINPVNQNIMYFGGLDSGMYKTTNNGINWFPINTGLTYNKILSMGISKSNPNVLYVGTDQNGAANSGIYKTTDAGATWTYVTTGITDTKAIQAIEVNPTNPSIAYACVFDGVNASTVGLWKTTDGGSNWFASSTGMTNMNILSVLINPLNPNVLYAGSSLILPASTGPSKIFKSYNGGTSWFEASNGLPTGTTTGDPVRCMSMSTVDTSVIIAGLFMNDTTGGVFLTTNSGQTWVKKFGGLPNVTASLSRSIAIRPGTTNQFYVGYDVKGVYRSTDGGVTFTDFTGGPLLNTYTIRALVFKTTGDTTLYAGASTPTIPAGKGTFEYTWPAPPPPPITGTWTEQTSPITTALNSVSAVNDDVAWACGAAGKVVRTTNKGVTWTNVSGNISATYALECIFAWDANIAITTGYSGTNTVIYQTSNGGVNWTLAYGPAAGFGDNVYMSDANTAYFIGDPVGGNWDLKKSTNGGLNWVSWATVPTANTIGTYVNGACFRGSQVWFHSPGLSTMHYSSDMGTSWTTFPTSLAQITSISFVSPTTGLVGGFSASPGLASTTNGGANWSTVTQSFIGASTVMGLVGNGSQYWVATETTVPPAIYYSSNNGANWVSQYPAPGTSIFYHITKSRSGATIWGVRNNGGISRYGAPIIGINPISTEAPSSYSLSQNYPNPFNPTTKINFALPKSGLVTIKVYDEIGKEVATLVNEVKNVGTYSVDFNGANLSSGVYFYKLSVNGFSEAKKMSLIK